MHKGAIVGASRQFVQSTPTHPLRTGLKAVVELTAYPDGKFGIAVSTIGGTQNRRTITIANSMILNDTDEAKDHTDAIIDFLAQLSAAGAAAAPAGGGVANPAPPQTGP